MLHTSPASHAAPASAISGPEPLRRRRAQIAAPAASSASSDGEVGGRLGQRHASSELRHSPENSAFVMKPRAGVASSRPRNAP